MSNCAFITGYERDGESGLDFAQARFFSSSVGRFLSADSMPPDLYAPQTFNLYRYALNNPQRYVDRDGRYEKDVHQELTTALAQMVGFSKSDAEAIGRATQHIDENPSTDPEAILNVNARATHHFTTVNTRAQHWFNFLKEVDSGDDALSALGTFFHAQQDSFSHEGFNPVTGQVSSGFRKGVILTRWDDFWEEVRKVDKTNYNPSKAERMAADTISRLLEARSRMERSGRYAAFGRAIPVALIQPYIARWVRAKDDDKPKILDEMKAAYDAWNLRMFIIEQTKKRHQPVRRQL
ncbi:MAG: RHS repeat-associated core domain-containing protein [Acidobacteria bacterium]|nr:RHS repeat-associated core domain-containing protein [Acidobacteriota bacterium]